MRLELIGGPRDGDFVHCCIEPVCECQTFGHGANNKIDDGYIEWLMYRRERGGWVPDRIQRQTMVGTRSCPRCSRPMPDGTVNCKNCGAEMDPLGSEMEII
jgi:hypothetical protein